MKTVNHDDQMKSEYKREDLGVGVRGKYYEAYQESHNLVLLKPEVAKAFPNDEALSSLFKLALASVNLTEGKTALSPIFKPNKT
ncbi:hypothetical protein PN36_11140 [Candidatus Thiomargarita nelsonii]|uniref:Uncharacterized protein n=1 Tax=Candidatus Thiomargarita nelsonii TaxID=1003181 RepID=A0A0A6RR42_9GAMM|nr:hypothetical protein PN36_11140 [Candidatus Thiomargarita nelsonii]